MTNVQIGLEMPIKAILVIIATKTKMTVEMLNMSQLAFKAFVAGEMMNC